MLKFGLLGNAKIAREQVCPAIIEAGHQVYALATTRPDEATETIRTFEIQNIYTDYEALLSDPEVDAVYIPLPNHLHVDYSIKALEAGKAVLCEKPIALDLTDLERLEVTAERCHGVLMEAYMVEYHPQWRQLRDEILPQIGPVQTAHAVFAYRNLDPKNIRASAQMGGGGLLDIGCYATLVGDWIFQDHPEVLAARLVLDREGGVDRLATALLDYGKGRTHTLTVATQACLYQRVTLLGSKGWAEVMVPFNPDSSATAHLRWEADGGRGEGQRLEFPIANQYTEMVKVFAAKVAAGDQWNNLAQSRRVITTLDAIRRCAVTDVVAKPHTS